MLDDIPIRRLSYVRLDSATELNDPYERREDNGRFAKSVFTIISLSILICLVVSIPTFPSSQIAHHSIHTSLRLVPQLAEHEKQLYAVKVPANAVAGEEIKLKFPNVPGVRMYKLPNNAVPGEVIQVSLDETTTAPGYPESTVGDESSDKENIEPGADLNLESAAAKSHSLHFFILHALRIIIVCLFVLVGTYLCIVAFQGFFYGYEALSSEESKDETNDNSTNVQRGLVQEQKETAASKPSERQGEYGSVGISNARAAPATSWWQSSHMQSLGEDLWSGEVLQEAWKRGKWLVGLMLFQSMSSLVLSHYEQLVKEHLVLTLFLTMLVGAGGNAGSQAVVKSISSIVVGDKAWERIPKHRLVIRQVALALLLAGSLSLVAWFRVWAFDAGGMEAIAIATSCFFIVSSSIFIGAALPYGMILVNLDPTHAAPVIQVFMDIWGVIVSCLICQLLLSPSSASTALKFWSP